MSACRQSCFARPENCHQAADELRRYAKYLPGVKVLPVYGGQDIEKQIRSLRGKVSIVVGTPGRVMDHMRRHTLKLEGIRMVVLDEADEMLNMGFVEDIETILGRCTRESSDGHCFQQQCRMRFFVSLAVTRRMHR